LGDQTIIVEIEAILKTLDSFVNMWSGENRQLSKFEWPEDLEFIHMEFESQIELDAYIEHDDYGKDPERPAVCFGFTVHEESWKKYELELFFNDAIVLDYRGIPP
jgi:hypothetical protein